MTANPHIRFGRDGQGAFVVVNVGAVDKPDWRLFTAPRDMQVAWQEGLFRHMTRRDLDEALSHLRGEIPL